MLYLPYLLCAALGYLFGSMPTGFLAGKARGIDIRRQGSGNIGATNVFRLLGKPAGVCVLLVDALKGYLPCVLLPGWIGGWFDLPNGGGDDGLVLVAGLGAVLGHNFTCWLNFRGGKGIATSAGVLIAWVPWALLAVFATWLVVFAASRYVSLASMCAAVALPFAVWWLHPGRGWLYLAITTALSVLAIIKHRSNIQRLLSGTEPRVGAAKAIRGGR